MMDGYGHFPIKRTPQEYSPKSEGCPCGITNRSNKLAQDFVCDAIHLGAIQFTLEDSSPCSFDPSRLTLGRTLAMLAQSYYRAYDLTRPDVIFGDYKNAPFVAALATTLGNGVECAFSRKKTHGKGEKDVLVGAPLEGKKVLVVDSALKEVSTKQASIRFVERHGGIPVGLCIIFDPQTRLNEGPLSTVQQFEQLHKIPVFEAAKMTDLIAALGMIPSQAEMLEKILTYKKRHCVTSPTSSVLDVWAPT